MKYKGGIIESASARADGEGGGHYMSAYQAAIMEKMAKLTTVEKQECDDKAKTLNSSHATKPSIAHILENQAVLPQLAAVLLKTLMGDDWGQAGDVVFVVHTIQPHSGSNKPVIHMTTVSGSNTNRKAFNIDDNDYKSFEETFVELARKWFNQVVQGKGKGKGKARTKTSPPPSSTIMQTVGVDK
ncbi:hypothetical protein AAF712_002564 [Marasmius tenuissimus]|uniref:Uncharacterized protein n=1 Tax=Marasmius tenuissimus TaxID=585030 RepID=A0ABR3A9V5_9AGAR